VDTSGHLQLSYGNTNAHAVSLDSQNWFIGPIDRNRWDPSCRNRSAASHGIRPKQRSKSPSARKTVLSKAVGKLLLIRIASDLVSPREALHGAGMSSWLSSVRVGIDVLN
jgi:hypothetical protein